MVRERRSTRCQPRAERPSDSTCSRASLRSLAGSEQARRSSPGGRAAFTVRSWERGENRPSSRLRARVEALVGSVKG